MEPFDPGVEQQVWQRVLSQPPEQRHSGLQELQREAMELAAIYRQLMGTANEKQRSLLKHLQEGEQANAACLRGLGLLSGKSGEVLRVWNPSKEPGRKLLEKCYHRTRRCEAEFMARSAEPEFGLVFRQLADREGQHCMWITQVLGASG